MVRGSAAPDVEEDALYAEERQEAIATLVTERGRVSVADLASAFEVTTETVRRDLDSLERSGVVRRVHGGAVPFSLRSGRERSLAERLGSNAEHKAAIARRALDLIPSDSGSILLDGGTTTNLLATMLPHDTNLSVVTNSVPAAGTLAGVSGIRLELLGGRVRGTTQACVGVDTVRALSKLHVDVAFIGTNGVSPTAGFTTPDPDEAAVKHAMLSAAQHVVILADSTKTQRDYLVRFAEVPDVDTLISDPNFDPRLLGALQEAGVEVLLG